MLTRQTSEDWVAPVMAAIIYFPLIKTNSFLYIKFYYIFLY